MPTRVRGVYENGHLSLNIPRSVHRATVDAVFYERQAGNEENRAERRAWLERLATMLPPEATEELRRNIEEAFEQVDEGDW
jgi:hypothetical protein